MKWNKLIQNETTAKDRKCSPLLEKFEPSRAGSRQKDANTANLTFKSCEKLRTHSPSTLVQRITSTPTQNANESTNRKSNSRRSNSNHTEIENLNRAYSTLQRSHNGLHHQLQELSKIIDTFSTELQTLVKNCMARFQQTAQSRQTKDEFMRRLSQSIDETASRCLVNSQPILMRAHTDLALASHKKHLNQLEFPADSPSDRQKNRLMRFKEDKVNQKNCFSKLEKTIEQTHTLLKQGDEPKFIRTSRLSKKDRSCDSSVEQMMEKSMFDSQRSHRNTLKARDTLYKVTKILNQ